MAMAALTLDHLSGGRFVLGLGASGPQVVEGWYGDDYRKPLARTREYVEIIRQVLAREAPVEFKGERYQLPNPNGTGLRQAAEVDRAPAARRPADLPRGRGPEERRARRPRSPTAGCRCSTRRAPTASTATRSPKGFARPGARRTRRRRSRSRATCRSSSPTTSRPRPNFYRPALALYIGGMGAREVNFHNDVFVRMGYIDEATHIQDLYLDGKKDEAAAAVPLAARARTSRSIGPKEKIRDDLEHVARVDRHDDDRVGSARAARDDRRARARLSERRDRASSLTAEEARVLGVPHGEGGHDARQLSAVGERGRRPRATSRRTAIRSCTYDETTVERALDSLREKELTRRVKADRPARGQAPPRRRGGARARPAGVDAARRAAAPRRADARAS